MHAPCAFEYAIVRVVPHVEREEFVNAGAIVFCAARDYLGARIALDETRLLAIAPDCDIDLVKRHLDVIPLICAGGVAAGAIGELTLRERWHWLVAPRSTILQTSAPHSGLGDVPSDALDRLVAAIVMPRVNRLKTP